MLRFRRSVRPKNLMRPLRPPGTDERFENFRRGLGQKPIK